MPLVLHGTGEYPFFKSTSKPNGSESSRSLKSCSTTPAHLPNHPFCLTPNTLPPSSLFFRSSSLALALRALTLIGRRGLETRNIERGIFNHEFRARIFKFEEGRLWLQVLYLSFFIVSREQAVEFAEFNAAYSASDSDRAENSTVGGTIEWKRVVCSFKDRETGCAEAEIEKRRYQVLRLRL